MDALIPPLILILGGAAIAAPSVWLAHRRGRSLVIWGALGVLMPLLSMVLLLILPAKRAEVY